MAETTQANRSQNVTKQMKQKTFSLLVSGVIIWALLLPVRVIGRLQHPEIDWKPGCSVIQLIWIAGPCHILFATIARFPYNKHFHELSELVDKFHTHAFDNFIQNTLRSSGFKNFCCILLDCTLALLDFHVK